MCTAERYSAIKSTNSRIHTTQMMLKCPCYMKEARLKRPHTCDSYILYVGHSGKGKTTGKDNR